MKSSTSFINSSLALIIILSLILVLPASTAFASADGPNQAGLGENISTIGTEPWQDPGNITEPGLPYATDNLYHLHLYSNYLRGTQYGFAIPDGAVITGIEVTINRMSNGQSPGIVDNVVSLVKAGNVVGDNKASLEPWSTTLLAVTYGGPTDLWGTTWSPEEVNSNDFGVVVAANRENNGNKARIATVDSMQITVYYDAATITTVDCGNGTPITTYGENITCVASVTSSIGGQTPTGTVDWSTDVSGVFEPNPCTLTGADGTATCSVTYTPAEVGSGSHLITATYSGDDYLTSSSGSQLVTVNLRPITVTADPQTKTYGDPDPEFTYQITSGSLVFSDTFTGTLTREPGEDAGAYAILQGTLALSVNYDLTYVGNYLNITQADPTCEVTPYAVTYDGDPHTATGACLGVDDEPLAGLDLSGTTHTDAGVYTDQWMFTDMTGNYNDLSGTITDTISKADPTCEITLYDVTYDGDPHTATGTCTGLMDVPLAGLDLSGTTHTNTGTYTDPWTFTDVNGNYNDLSGTITDSITPVDITIMADPQSKIYGDPDPELTYQVTEGSLVPGELFTGTLTRDPGEDVGTYAILQGTLELSPNYALTFVGDSLSITPRAITVTADSQTKIIGHPDPELTYTVTEGSLVPGDTFTGTLVREPGEDKGTYAILQGTLVLSTNYELTYVSNSLTISDARYWLPIIIIR